MEKSQHTVQSSTLPQNGGGVLEQIHEQFCSIKDKKTWEELTPAEKRVAIMEDVKLRLESGNIKARTRLYIGNTRKIDLVAEQKLNCQACAKGAIFISAFAKTGKSILAPEDSKMDPSSSLGEIFDKEQLDLMEYVFERGKVYNGSSETDYDGSSVVVLVDNPEAMKMAKKLRGESTNDRLLAICDNVIENKGTFVP